MPTPASAPAANQELIDASWREHEADGKKYYSNAYTKETTWEMPEAFAKLQQAQRPPPQGPSYVAGGASSYLPPYSQKYNERDDFQPPERRFTDREDRYGGGSERERGGVSFISTGNEPAFASREEAEAAFMKMLKKSGVQPDWSWPQAVRACITDSNWKAIPDFNGREEAFKKYCADLRSQEKEKEQDRQAKVRSNFMAMLRSHPEIKWYTRWKTALPIIENESIFRTARDDNERRQLFEEYILSLKKAYVEDEEQERASAIDKIADILQNIDLEPYTRWKDAQEAIQKNPEYIEREKVRPFYQIDVLNAFEKHIKQLQVQFSQKVSEDKRVEKRVERKNRDAFRELLDELKKAGKLKATTKWMEIHGLIEDDPRYQNMLGQDGSSPLDLFWDVIEDQERVLRNHRNVIYDLLDDHRFEITSKTPFEEFLSDMRLDPRANDIDDYSLNHIFEYLLEKVKNRERRQMDDFRSALKHLEPPILVTDTWEDIRPRVEKLKEFRELDAEKLRAATFEKYIRRLKEKEQEKRDRGERTRREGRDRERDRDREYRNGQSDRQRRHHTRTHSPEQQDPYEADRRKAQQDRESRYKKEGATGLSPPYRRDRERERDDHRPFDRGSRQSSGDHYGRERREREVERERNYVSRTDPRERPTELDYGDSRPMPSRRRRDSDEDGGSGRRDNKRARYSPRRDRRTRSRSPAMSAPPEPLPPKEDPGLRSGSEEGEIEET
ncbi:uncharacterized protein BDR25DRAFT_320178 [Lindgomyces ingoldianus]|uniref:Uncharacterized protein n=1 Tax=Lindgomyces ingoldianus TaxID=673940 RepID=A0ACB6Q9E7_9PLEO|nr:uncharacterized protein BDR25DRAFT_320178 [Lindgomyces ingoldianus]KAF2463165.1 hypothetical protein BDR25DRAFT_320178 [Lindgomyces ingoldianus]